MKIEDITDDHISKFLEHRGYSSESTRKTFRNVINRFLSWLRNQNLGQSEMDFSDEKISTQIAEVMRSDMTAWRDKERVERFVEFLKEDLSISKERAERLIDRAEEIAVQDYVDRMWEEVKKEVETEPEN